MSVFLWFMLLTCHILCTKSGIPFSILAPSITRSCCGFLWPYHHTKDPREDPHFPQELEVGLLTGETNIWHLNVAFWAWFWALSSKRGLIFLLPAEPGHLQPHRRLGWASSSSSEEASRMNSSKSCLRVAPGHWSYWAFSPHQEWPRGRKTLYTPLKLHSIYYQLYGFYWRGWNQNYRNCIPIGNAI